MSSKSVECFLNVQHLFALLHLSSFTSHRARDEISGWRCAVTAQQLEPEADLESRGDDVGRDGVVDAADDGVGGGGDVKKKRGGGGRWVVGMGLAAHWARGLAHPSTSTDPALRRGRSLQSSRQEGTARTGAAEASKRPE